MKILLCLALAFVGVVVVVVSWFGWSFCSTTVRAAQGATRDGVHGQMSTDTLEKVGQEVLKDKQDKVFAIGGIVGANEAALAVEEKALVRDREGLAKSENALAMEKAAWDSIAVAATPPSHTRVGNVLMTTQELKHDICARVKACVALQEKIAAATERIEQHRRQLAQAKASLKDGIEATRDAAAVLADAAAATRLAEQRKANALLLQEMQGLESGSDAEFGAVIEKLNLRRGRCDAEAQVRGPSDSGLVRFEDAEPENPGAAAEEYFDKKKADADGSR